ncbi:LysR family transcriptional regulator [Nocardiopsis deserti]|uniref:LysR family transcriptional regulator n=1 Tax=Nocardiopsis deserti TaxID=2605988 RepID=UPI001680334E|nr:LysR substrate-binding domain-containing protein [Nocardiopsis deserti]
MVDLREIEAFLAVADELHFGRAADRLQISQPRTSQVVRTLERRIGAPLFVRSSRRVELTPLGEQLRGELEPAYEQLRAGISRAKASVRGVEGLLKVGFLGTAANELTQKILTTFRVRHPACEVAMTETHFADHLGPLRRGEVDILITRLPVEEPDLVVGPVLVREPRVLAVGADHPFAGREQVRMEDLARDKVFAVATSAPDYWWDFHVPPATPGGAVIERGAQVATFQELLALIASGQGISPVAESVARYYGRPDIVYIPLPDAPDTEVALVWRAGGLTARAEALTQAAVDVIRANGGPAGGPAEESSGVSGTT